MAVELHRTRESFPISSPQEFQLFSKAENEVVFHGCGDYDYGDDNIDCFDYLEALSSDFQSELASSETESSVELTRDIMNTQEKVKESWDFGGWASKTTIWSPFGSSSGSAEEGSSQEATPPTTPAIEKRHCVWGTNGMKLNGTINTITENIEKMDIKANVNNKNVKVPKYPPVSRANCSQNQPPIRPVQFHKLKKEVLLEQQRSGNNMKNQLLDDIIINNKAQTAKKQDRGRHPRKWANYKHQGVTGPGMRALFLDRPGSKTGSSCGTGVFLPCVTGDTSHSSKKKGCPPVLIPAKVMQALKVHFERMDNLSKQNNSLNLPLQRDNNNLPKNNVTSNSQKKCQSRSVPSTNQNDICLPQDWTY